MDGATRPECIFGADQWCRQILVPSHEPSWSFCSDHSGRQTPIPLTTQLSECHFIQSSEQSYELSTFDHLSYPNTGSQEIEIRRCRQPYNQRVASFFQFGRWLEAGKWASVPLQPEFAGKRGQYLGSATRQRLRRTDERKLMLVKFFVPAVDVHVRVKWTAWEEDRAPSTVA